MKKVKTILFILITYLVFNCNASANTDVTFKLIGSQNASSGMLSTDVQIAFEVLFNGILEKTGEKVEMSMYEEFTKVEDLFLKDQEYGGFYCSSVEFVQSNMIDHVDENMLITSVYNNERSRRILLVVKKDSEILGIDDLYNHDITYGQSSDLIELYLNTVAIQSRGLVATKYFKTINSKLNGSESLVSLFFGHTDIAAVYEDEYIHALELNPQLKEGLKIISESPYLINAVVGIRKDGVKDETKNLFIQTALTLDSDKKGKRMLSMYGAEKFEHIKLDDLESVRNLLSIYNEHINTK